MKTSLFLCVTLLAVIALSYQNCAGPAGNTLGASDEDNKELSEQAVYKSAPFAYDISLNQISYMSCTQLLSSGSNDARDVSDKKAYFTIRAGAYGPTAGIKISDSIITYANKNFSPVAPTINDPDPTTGATNADIKKLIQNSPSKLAQMQIAVRGRNNPITTLVSLNGGTQGVDIANLLVPLSNDVVLDQLLEKAKAAPMNYFYGDVSSRTLEGSLYFNSKDESIAADFRNGLSSDDMLILGYVKPSSTEKSASFVPVPAGSSTDRMEGLGFKLSFTSLYTQNRDLPNRILESVVEVDASSPSYQPKDPWTCSPDNRYVIVDPSDAFGVDTDPADGMCPIQSIASRNLPAQQAARVIVERHLPADKWYINTELKCVVPRVGRCYGNIETEYDSTLSCDVAGSTKDCAHYISICTKN